MEQDLNGLSDQEVAESRLKFGSNTLGSDKHDHLWPILKDIVKEPMFFILLLSACLYFVLSNYFEGLTLLIALLFTSAISAYQQNKSDKAVKSLKKITASKAVVTRNGQIITLPVEDIVVQDLIRLEDGGTVPADARIVVSNDFSVDESILTGESLPIFKTADNIIYKGCTIMTGSCMAKVCAVGKQTEIGKIGKALESITNPQTPLQIQIRAFIRSMVTWGLIAFILVCLLNYYTSKDWVHSLLHGLTLAMSVLPEEIPVAFSTFMALGAYHLYRNGIITKGPNTVESLGAATVICIDKTGTITENTMRLSAIYDFKSGRLYDYRKEPYSFTEVLEYAMWSSETEPFDAMEKSVHKVYSEVAEADLRKDFLLTQEYPLSGTPPIMTHVFKGNKASVIAVKGSVEGVLNQTSISENQKADINKISSSLSAEGFRVLAVGKSEQDINNLPASQHDFNFELLGLVAFYDPPKTNIQQVLKEFYSAGIQVKIISGDHPETVSAIARQIHFEDTSAALTGNEVIKMDQPELCRKVEEVSIFARMNPEAKLKVIEALKINGEVIAMTGDGVNDSPALKAAHIGIAMGDRGTEVAKQSASMILIDDDLKSMVVALQIGRKIYENLKKAIRYIISIHIPIILIVTLPLLLFWPYTDIFSPVHVIFLEIIMGPTCSIVFEREPAEPGLMKQPPRKSNTNLFAMHELSLSVLQGILITIACLATGYYFMQSNETESTVRTVIYTTLVFSNLFLTFSNRSFSHPVLTTAKYKNRLLFIVAAVSIIILFSFIYFGPLQHLFGFSALSGNKLMVCVSAAFLGVVWIELFKIRFARKENSAISFQHFL